MTSTRPRGERAHAPHPDVTIVTTTSSFLSGPRETPDGTEEISVNLSTWAARIEHRWCKFPWESSKRQKQKVLWPTFKILISNGGKKTCALDFPALCLLIRPSKLVLPVSPAQWFWCWLCLLWVSCPSVSAGLGHGEFKSKGQSPKRRLSNRGCHQQRSLWLRRPIQRWTRAQSQTGGVTFELWAAWRVFVSTSKTVCVREICLKMMIWWQWPGARESQQSVTKWHKNVKNDLVMEAAPMPADFSALLMLTGCVLYFKQRLRGCYVLWRMRPWTERVWRQRFLRAARSHIAA